MKPLKLLQIEARNKGGGPFDIEPRSGYFSDVYRAIAPFVRQLIEGMANTHTLEQVEAFQADLRRAVATPSDFHEISARELLQTCEQIRTLWRELGSNAGKKYRPTRHHILAEWWKHYPLSDDKHWLVSYETRTFFPQNNFRALIATILFENRTHMKTCANCNLYFFGRRHDSKYCMRLECQRAYGTARQEKLQKSKSKKPS